MDFTLRPWEEQDIAAVAKYADNAAIARWLRDVFPHPYTLADAEFYVRDCMEKEGQSQLCRAIVCGGEAVGSIGVFQGADVYRRSAELGYWLAEPYWGLGIMTRAVRLLAAEAFDALDIVRLYAEPFAENTGSRRVLEKAGFALEGVLRRSVYKAGRLGDSCLYSLLKEDPRQGAENRDD